jgi:ABC-type Fe3+/spermidine/putrescine transport system ATPase subunit
MATQLGDFDFGFTAVSETELKAMEQQLKQTVEAQSAELIAVSKTYEEKLNTMYKMVMPLLKNLAKDSDKDYIYWPDRHKKMADFIVKVDELMKA